MILISFSVLDIYKEYTMDTDFSKNKLDYKIKVKNTNIEPLTEEYLMQVCKKLSTSTPEELQAQAERKKKISRNIDFFMHLPKNAVLDNFSKEEIMCLSYIVGQAATGNLIIVKQQGIKTMEKAVEYIDCQCALEDSFYNHILSIYCEFL